MKMFLLVVFSLVTSSTGYNSSYQESEHEEYPESSWHKKYKPDWDDLMTRPLPSWFDRAKIGFMIHWGVYSVPAFGSEWFWVHWQDIKKAGHIRYNEIKQFMQNTYFKKKPNMKYEDFVELFKAERFDPDMIAALLKDAGAKYVVVTSKHHDGFALFPSERPKWNAMTTGPNRDLLGEISLAVKKMNMIFGVQYSLYEWYNPDYLSDKAANFKNYTYRDKMWRELKSIVNRYAPTVIRAHGDFEASGHYWRAQDFLAWLYNSSPVRKDVIVNDKWGLGIRCIRGGYSSCVHKYSRITLQKRKWENTFSLDSQSYGYRTNMTWSEMVPIKDVVKTIVETVSCGGNVLINIGLTKEGEVPNMLEYALLDLGEWLKINGEAIYESSPWFVQNDEYNDNVWYTCKKTQYNIRHPTSTPRKNDNITAIYAAFFVWPPSSKLKLKSIVPYIRTGTYSVEMLGQPGSELKWTWAKKRKGIEIHLPRNVWWNYAWVVKFAFINGSSNEEERLEAEKSKRKWAGLMSIHDFPSY